MPNWCSNQVIMTRPADTKLDEFMKFLEKYDDDYSEGHVPEGIKPTDSWLFNISMLDDDSFSFESKWAPPIKTMVEIAKMFKFSFAMDYEEGGSIIYGQCTYDFATDTLLDKQVEGKDWPEHDEDEDPDRESYYDVLDRVLEEMEYKILKV